MKSLGSDWLRNGDSSVSVHTAVYERALSGHHSSFSDVVSDAVCATAIADT